MATVRNFEIIGLCDEFNVVRIFASEDRPQKWTAELDTGNC
jgi:hypothetical protein